MQETDIRGEKTVFSEVFNTYISHKHVITLCIIYIVALTFSFIMFVYSVVYTCNFTYMYYMIQHTYLRVSWFEGFH